MRKFSGVDAKKKRIDSKRSLPHESDTRGGYDLPPLLSAEAQAALNDEQITIEDVKIPYRELFRPVESAVESGRPESFAKVYISCQDDLEA